MGAQSIQFPPGELPTQLPLPKLIELKANSTPSSQIENRPRPPILTSKGTGHCKGW